MRQVEMKKMLKQLGIGAVIGSVFSVIGVINKLPASSIPLFIGTGVATSYLLQSKSTKSGNFQEDLNNIISDLPEDEHSKLELQQINNTLYPNVDIEGDAKMPVNQYFAQVNVIRKSKKEIT